MSFSLTNAYNLVFEKSKNQGTRWWGVKRMDEFPRDPTNSFKQVSRAIGYKNLCLLTLSML